MDYSKFRLHHPQMSDARAHCDCTFTPVHLSSLRFREKLTCIPNGNMTTSVGYSGQGRFVPLSDERYSTYIAMEKENFYREVCELLTAFGWTRTEEEDGVYWKR